MTIARIDDKKCRSQTNTTQKGAPNWEYGFNQGVTRRRQRWRKKRNRAHNFIVEMNDALEKVILNRRKLIKGLK